jgi:hypothetical protein
MDDFSYENLRLTRENLMNQGEILQNEWNGLKTEYERIRAFRQQHLDSGLMAMADTLAQTHLLPMAERIHSVENELRMIGRKIEEVDMYIDQATRVYQADQIHQMQQAIRAQLKYRREHLYQPQQQQAITHPKKRQSYDDDDEFDDDFDDFDDYDEGKRRRSTPNR